MPGEPGPRTAGRRGCAVASVLRSKTLVQGESTSPEQIKFPWGGATTGSEIQKGKHRKAVLSFLVEAAGVEPVACAVKVLILRYFLVPSVSLSVKYESMLAETSLILSPIV